jgi:hypothetical protein
VLQKEERIIEEQDNFKNTYIWVLPEIIGKRRSVIQYSAYTLKNHGTFMYHIY